MNYLDFFLPNDATMVVIPETVANKQKVRFTSPYFEEQYNAYLAKRPWDFAGALAYINSLAKLQSLTFTTGKVYSEQEKQAADKRVEKQGLIEKEQKDLEQGMETVSAGMDYISPTYWYNKIADPEHQITSTAGQVVGDIVLDPTTWLSAGMISLAKSAGKQAVKKGVKTAGKLAAKRLNSETVLSAVPGLSKYVFRDADSKLQYNMPLLAADIQKGKDDAIQFFAADVYTETQKHNKELAARLGYPNFVPGRGLRAAGAPLNKNVGIYYDLKSSVGGSFTRLTDDATLDEIKINAAHYEAAPSTYHEFLHRGELGGLNWELLNVLNGAIRKDTKNFLQFKTDKLLNLRMLNTPFGEYLDKLGEAAANAMEVGYRMGIKPGTPYPGDKTFLEMIDAYKGKLGDKEGVFEYFNMNKPKRVWDAMTGKYFMIPAAGVGSGTMLYSNDNLQ